MVTLLCGLAVYKVLQVILVLLPREPMPWVKVLAGVVVSFGVALAARVDYVVLSALAIATLAGATHSAIRLLTYAGDLAFRKSIK
jgi:hypothetical protein